MPTGRHFRCLLAATATLLAAGASVPSASAQMLWDWGGDNNIIAGTGRQVVKFSTNYQPGQLIVSFGDRLLYHVTRPGEAVSYPIAIPREQSRWQGVMTVTQKRINPSWTPTPEMRAENPRLPSWVPGGHPMNPLGVRGLYLGSSTYRIHGTDAPWTIGQPVSKGCIRMYNQDVIDLDDRVPVGTKVTVTWNSFKGGAVIASGPPMDSRPQDPQRSPPLARMQDNDQARPNYSSYYFDDRSDYTRYRADDQRRREVRAPARDRAVQSSASVSAASVPPTDISRTEAKPKAVSASRAAAASETASYRAGDDEPYSVDRKSDPAPRAAKAKPRPKDADIAELPPEQRTNKDKPVSAEAKGQPIVRTARVKETDAVAAGETPYSVNKRASGSKAKVSTRSGRGDSATDIEPAAAVNAAALSAGSSDQTVASAASSNFRKPLRRARASGTTDTAAAAAVSSRQTPAAAPAPPTEVTPD